MNEEQKSSVTLASRLTLVALKKSQSSVALAQDLLSPPMGSL